MHVRTTISLCFFLLAFQAVGGPPVLGDACAETYIAGEFGVSYPNDLRQIDITTAGFTSLTQSDLDLDTSLLYGVRLGHYFRSARWLGVETHISLTQPGIVQQDITLTGPGGSTTFPNVPGENFRVITWTPMALTFRYPGKRLQPYLGAGPAFFLARIKDKVTNDSQNDTSFGISAYGGLRYYLARHWAVYIEGRFTGLTRFKFKETPNLDGFNADYDAIHGMVGVGYHF